METQSAFSSMRPLTTSTFTIKRPQAEKTTIQLGISDIEHLDDTDETMAGLHTEDSHQIQEKPLSTSG